NALATSATNDWYIPYFARAKSESHHVAAARMFTAVFALFMILIASAFAYAKVKNPDVRIIPVVLGIAFFILGPMLGVFLLGMLTKRRGSDLGNTLALTGGLAVTSLFGGNGLFWNIPWLPKVTFTWFDLLGASVVWVIGIVFRTPDGRLEAVERAARDAAESDETPVDMRGDTANLIRSDANKP